VKISIYRAGVSVAVLSASLGPAAVQAVAASPSPSPATASSAYAEADAYATALLEAGGFNHLFNAGLAPNVLRNDVNVWGNALADQLGVYTVSP
jgi:hypothetical protein